jgi:hypothetical protein
MQAMKRKWFIFLMSLYLVSQTIFAQTDTSIKYNQHEAFSPLFYSQNENEYRSATGQPGNKYWQNRADYKITCALDTNKNELKGSVDITYKNNSPDELSFLWLQLDQNIFISNSRAT